MSPRRPASTAAFVYARISDDPTGQSAGVERQERLCRDLAVRRGLEVEAVYVDNDVSAYRGRRRKGFEAMLQALTPGSTVVAYHPDRLYRHPKDLERFIDTVDRAKANVVTVAAGDVDLTTASGRMVARMLGAAARGESERIGERVSAAHQEAIANGRYRGRTPFGYMPDGRGSITPHPEHARLVRRAVKDVLAGASVRSIARRWTDLGLSGKTPTSVRRTLQSPALCGLTSQMQPGGWKALVTREHWDALQAIMRGNAARGSRTGGRAPSTLLGGIITCAEHGTTLFGGSHDTYRADPLECGVSIRRSIADDAVTAAIDLSFAAHGDVWVEAFSPVVDAEADPMLGDLSERRQAIVDLIAQGLIRPAEAAAQLRALGEAIDSAQPKAPVALPGDPSGWKSWDLDYRRAVVPLVLGTVAVDHGHGPDRLHLEYRQ